MCVAVACLAAVSYASKTHGKHHACGHDGHMASLLAVAKIVAGMARRLKGIVKFIFQVPASIPMRAHIPSTCVCVQDVQPVCLVHLRHTIVRPPYSCTGVVP